MFFITCLKILSILLGIVGFTFIIPLTVALCYGESQMIPVFLIPMIISLIVMLIINIPTRKNKFHLATKQIFYGSKEDYLKTEIGKKFLEEVHD